MDERSGGAEGESEALSGRASVPTVPKALAVRYTKPQLRAIVADFYETASEESRLKLIGLPNNDWAWIAAQDEFKTYIIASQAKAALGLGQMTKQMQRAQDWFIKAASRPNKEPKERKRRVPQEVRVVDAGGGGE